MRLTKLINNQYVCEENSIKIIDNYITGEVIEKLAKVENMIG